MLFFVWSPRKPALAPMVAPMACAKPTCLATPSPSASTSSQLVFVALQVVMTSYALTCAWMRLCKAAFARPPSMTNPGGQIPAM